MGLLKLIVNTTSFAKGISLDGFHVRWYIWLLLVNNRGELTPLPLRLPVDCALVIITWWRLFRQYMAWIVRVWTRGTNTASLYISLISAFTSHPSFPSSEGLKSLKLWTRSLRHFILRIALRTRNALLQWSIPLQTTVWHPAPDPNGGQQESMASSRSWSFR